MQSHALCTINNRNLDYTGFLAFSRSRIPPSRVSFDCRNINRCSYSDHKLFESRVRRHGFRVRRGVLRVCSMDDDSVGVSSLDDWEESNIPVAYYMFSSSEGEDSDGDISLQPITDVDLPTSKEQQLLQNDDSVNMTAHRLAKHGRTQKKRKKTVVPLPAPFGLVCLGKYYPVLTSFCFVSMANGINLTDGLDGLAAGTAALAFIGMSIVVLPICSDLSIFGASMAGACVGFLFQNRYKASIFMGDTGALALGGALAAMASCTGMFFPLFIASGIFVLETLSVIIQVSFFKAAKCFQRRGYRLFRMAPFHHHLELCGIKEPTIVAAAYIITSVLILCAAYIGLTSA